jgi:hypothetical protein
MLNHLESSKLPLCKTAKTPIEKISQKVETQADAEGEIMNRIKVFKKSVAIDLSRPFQTVQANPKVKEREIVRTVENWIADWRTESEIKTRVALQTLADWKLGDSLKAQRNKTAANRAQ